MATKSQGQVSRGSFLSLGATGWVHKINDRIVLKTPRKADCEKFAYELAIYDILESCRSLCPDIAQSFLRVPAGNFLAHYSGGTLDQRVQRHQIRDQSPLGGMLIEIKEKESLKLVKRWIRELTSAAAWLEYLGYVHTDIRPPNLLLDGDDHLKLADFDCMAKIGTRTLGGAPPWCRVLGSEGGVMAGSFGFNGARVEQFAIGSVLYVMTQGHEPYDDGEFGPQDGKIVVRMLRRLEFPAVGEGELDKVVGRCWRGEYACLVELADEVVILDGMGDDSRAIIMGDKYCEDVREECRILVEGGLLNKVT